ncbi:MAG: DUF177 domain-containing protein [Pseudomonadota bacterium]
MSEFTRELRLVEIPDGQIERVIRATDTEREAIADRLGLEGVGDLTADIRIERPPDNVLIRVRGEVKATVRQICIATLEPFDSDIAESFETSFTSASTRKASDIDVVVDPVGDDEPEPVMGGRIDLGELVIQYLSLALDPHPRNPDVGAQAFAEGIGEGDGSEDRGGKAGDDNPFAVLERWKPRP